MSFWLTRNLGPDQSGQTPKPALADVIRQRCQLNVIVQSSSCVIGSFAEAVGCHHLVHAGTDASGFVPSKLSACK